MTSKFVRPKQPQVEREELKQHNIKGFELNLPTYRLFREQQETAIHQRRKRQINKAFNGSINAVHAYFDSIAPGLDGRTLPLTKQWDETTQRFATQNLELANYFISTEGTMRPVIFHLGPAGNQSPREAIDTAAKNMSYLLKYCQEKKYSLHLLVENTPPDTQDMIGTTARDLSDLLVTLHTDYPETKENKNFGFTIDFSHSRATDYKTGRAPLDTFKDIVEVMGEHIHYAHLNYNNDYMMKDLEGTTDDFADIDAHAPFTGFEDGDEEEVKQAIHTMYHNTGIKKYNMINLEIFPRTWKVFGLTRTTFPYGFRDIHEVYQSVKFIKDAINGR